MANEDSGQPTAPPPAPLIKNAKAKHGFRLTFELYETIWLFYRDSDRKATTVAKQFGISTATIGKIINVGYPDNNWPSLKERGSAWDMARMNQDTLSQASAYAEVHDQWNIAKRDNLKLAAASKSAIAMALRKAMDAVQHMKFVKYRRVKDPAVPGGWALIETPMNGREISDSLRLLANAIRDIGAFEAFWLGGKAPQDQDTPLKGWAHLSEDQLAYIARTGQLPPGVTDDTLFGFSLPTQPDPGSGKN